MGAKDKGADAQPTPDIVGRLRALPHIVGEAALCAEAADEILRLRIELANVQDLLKRIGTPVPVPVEPPRCGMCGLFESAHPRSYCPVFVPVCPACKGNGSLHDDFSGVTLICGKCEGTGRL
jgi:hypothetical protein